MYCIRNFKVITLFDKTVPSQVFKLFLESNKLYL